jgi:hypothetical protein
MVAMSSTRRIIVLFLALALLAALTGSTRRPNADVSNAGSIKGVAYRIVDQTVIDGVVVDEVLAPVVKGEVAIPELEVDVNLGSDCTFDLSDLTVSASSDDPAELTVVFSAPDLVRSLMKDFASVQATARF